MGDRRNKSSDMTKISFKPGRIDRFHVVAKIAWLVLVSVTALKKCNFLQTFSIRFDGSWFLQDTGQLNRLLRFQAARQGFKLGPEVERGRRDRHGQSVVPGR